MNNKAIAVFRAENIAEAMALVTSAYETMGLVFDIDTYNQIIATEPDNLILIRALFVSQMLHDMSNSNDQETAKLAVDLSAAIRRVLMESLDGHMLEG